jgi:hypothetical protein
MKTLHRILFSIILISGLIVIASCARQEKYGQEISNRQLTPIKDILANPKAYENKTVTISGKIDNECQTGCWFYVKVADGNVVIYVDIGKSGLAIPQYSGKKVLVEGEVIIKEAGPMIQGKGVEIQ